MCVCVFCNSFWYFLVGPFSGACVYPSGCRSTRRVGAGAGGGGGGEAGKWGWSSSFFARDELWSRGSVSDSWGMCVSLSCSAAAFWVFLELNLWNSDIVFVFVIGCVVEEWIHSRFFWELAAYVHRVLFGIWDRDWERERERERERSRGVCVPSSSSSSSAAAQEGIWIAPFCSFVYLSRSKTLLTEELVVLGSVQTN